MTARCFSCGTEATGLHWIRGGAYFACEGHSNEPPSGTRPSDVREAMKLLDSAQECQRLESER